MADNWLDVVSKIRTQFEYAGTALEQPPLPAVTKLTLLTDALGGDPATWLRLEGAVKSPAAFFQLLQAKAHYLLLPEPIVTALGASGLVDLSELTPSSKAEGETTVTATGVLIKIPGMFAAVAQAGYPIGRSVGLPDPYYQKLKVIYHEMTHAWIILVAKLKIVDADLATLATDGYNDYLSARDLYDHPLDPASAFLEAAGYYVGDKIDRWCAALAQMDILLRNNMPAGELRDKALQQIIDDYEKPKQIDVFVGSSLLLAPPLSSTLRAAIDAKVLDGLPLTKAFAATPLADLAATLKR